MTSSIIQLTVGVVFRQYPIVEILDHSIPPVADSALEIVIQRREHKLFWNLKNDLPWISWFSAVQPQASETSSRVGWCLPQSLLSFASRLWTLFMNPIVLNRSSRMIVLTVVCFHKKVTVTVKLATCFSVAATTATIGSKVKLYRCDSFGVPPCACASGIARSRTRSLADSSSYKSEYCFLSHNCTLAYICIQYDHSRLKLYNS